MTTEERMVGNPNLI